MVNVIIKAENVNIPQNLKTDIKELLQDINLSEYQIQDYVLYILFNMDDSSIKNTMDLDGKNKYILFQNIPSKTNYDIGFETALTKFRIRLQRFNKIDKIDYQNIVFVFDFSQNPITCKESITDIHGDKDRRLMFVPTAPKYTMESVIMSDEMKMEIEDALSIIRHREKIYNEWGYQEVDPQARAVLSFYGPAGTGKTKCAHGVASALGKKILCVNYANIESMWAGESPKNLISAFNVAQENNAVLFMDEADSFLGKRITNVTSGHDQSINSLRSQMLILLEDFEGVVIFGTNLVENFDKAFETRILKSIKFELPDESARINLFKLMIPSKVPFVDSILEEDFLKFAQESDGFSGREIKNVILETLSRGARCNIPAFTPQMFIDAIIQHADSKNKLQKEKEQRESRIEEALVDNIISESERLYHEALIHIAIHAMKIDGVLNEKEKKLITMTSKMLDVKLQDIDEENIPTVPIVCEHFSTLEQKRAALDIACKIIAIDEHISNEEMSFVKNLFCVLGYDIVDLTKVEEYLNLLIMTNRALLSI